MSPQSHSSRRGGAYGSASPFEGVRGGSNVKEISALDRRPSTTRHSVGFKVGVKQMKLGRRRGAQPNNTNAVTHGRHSRATRLARLAEAQKRRSASETWLMQIPDWDWQSLCKAIRKDKK